MAVHQLKNAITFCLGLILIGVCAVTAGCVNRETYIKNEGQAKTLGRIPNFDDIYQTLLISDENFVSDSLRTKVSGHNT